MGSIEVIKTIKGKVGKFLSLKVSVFIFATVLLLAIALLVYKSIAFDNAVGKLEVFQRQSASVQEILEGELKASDARVQELEKKLLLSNSTIAKLKIQIQKEREVYASVKLPKDKQEILDRLNAMDYHPR